MRASAHIRLRVSVQRPTTIHAGEIIYLQDRGPKDPLNQYALYENTNPITLLGPMVAEDPRYPLHERDPSILIPPGSTSGSGGRAGAARVRLVPHSEHATPVLVATGAQFTRKNEVQFVTIVAYGFGHLSAEKSDLDPPDDIAVTGQMHVEYDPNICRGVMCKSSGSPFCKAVYSVPMSMARADTDVYLTLTQLFATPGADRDAIDGEEVPTRDEVILDASRALDAGATETAGRLISEQSRVLESVIPFTPRTERQFLDIKEAYVVWKRNDASAPDPRFEIDNDVYAADNLLALLREYETDTAQAQTVASRTLRDDIEFVERYKAALQRQFEIRAATRPVASDLAARRDALNTLEKIVKQSGGTVETVQSLGSTERPKGKRVKKKKT